MTRNEFYGKCKCITKYWGYNNIPMMAMEELSELSVAISKKERKHHSENYEAYAMDFMTDLVNVEKEIADVLISIGCICELYDIDYDDVLAFMEQKMNKKYDK